MPTSGIKVSIFMAFAVMYAICVGFALYFPAYYKRRRSWKVMREAGELRERPSSDVLELYIWVLVITVSGPVAYVGFVYTQPFGYSRVSITSEAKTNLGALFTTQVAYFGEYGAYAGRAGEGIDGAFLDLGWAPEGKTFYAYYVGEAIMPNTKSDPVTYKPGGDWPLEIKPRADASSFTIIAIANLDQDPCIDAWAINDAKMLTQLVSDIPDETLADACPGCVITQKPLDFTREKSFQNIYQSIYQSIVIVTLVITLTLPAMIIVHPLLIILMRKESKRMEAAMAQVIEAVDSKGEK